MFSGTDFLNQFGFFSDYEVEPNTLILASYDYIAEIKLYTLACFRN